MKKILSLFAALALALILFSMVGTGAAKARVMWNPCANIGNFGEYCDITYVDGVYYAYCRDDYSGICAFGN